MGAGLTSGVERGVIDVDSEGIRAAGSGRLLIFWKLTGMPSSLQILKSPFNNLLSRSYSEGMSAAMNRVSCMNDYDTNEKERTYQLPP